MSDLLIFHSCYNPQLLTTSYLGPQAKAFSSSSKKSVVYVKIFSQTCKRKLYTYLGAGWDDQEIFAVVIHYMLALIYTILDIHSVIVDCWLQMQLLYSLYSQLHYFFCL